MANPLLRLRDLDDDAFRARYDIDRFTATVLSNRFRYLVHHMCSKLLTHAFSPIIRDSADLSGTLSGPAALGFPMAAVSETLPLFYGSIPDAVRITLEEYGIERLAPGDMVIVNDYYRVGTHLNDVCSIRPVFHGGNLIGAVTIRAHMLDMGGIAAGGFECTKRDVYEDGLCLPPILLYSRGEPVASTFKLLFDNTRFAPMIVPDLRTVFHSLELGERLLIETIEKYGLAAYTGAIRYVEDAAAEAMGEALQRLPDGDYHGEEWLDSDGLPGSEQYCVRVRIRKVADRAEFDFRGSSPATRTAVNCSWADVKSGIAIALKYLIDPKNPVTSGTLRNIDAVVPPDTLLNASPPHACHFYWEPVQAIIYAIFSALNPVLGPDSWGSNDWGGLAHRIEGSYPDGTPLQPIHTDAGGAAWGATRHGDGDSSQQMVTMNMLASGVEAAEHPGCPALHLRLDYVPDSGGPGANRGGVANIFDDLFRLPASHRIQQFHVRRPPGGGGVNGGRAGLLGGVWLWDGNAYIGPGAREPGLSITDPLYAEARVMSGVVDPKTGQVDPGGEYVFVTEKVPAGAGSVIRTLTMGGGGWGEPLTRDPARVLIDVRDGYVSISGAARDYGVVILGDPDRDPEGLRVDEAATLACRDRYRCIQSGSEAG